MSEQTLEQVVAGRVAEQLIAIRRRGLHKIDQRPRTEATETEQLAWDYCQAGSLRLHGRIAQITKLIQDGLVAYGEQGNEYDRQLIHRLFFDPLVTAPKEGPTTVLQQTLEESGKNESDFRAERHERFGRFAEYLVAFVADAQGDATQDAVATPELKAPPKATAAPTRRRSLLWLTAGIAALLVAGGAVTALVASQQHAAGGQTGHLAPQPATSPSSSSPPFVSGKTYTEQAGQFGAPTFTDPHNPAVTGVRVPPYQKVEISCKVLAPTIPSVSPDGYWYRIASPGWDGKYYAAANTFQNGDPIGGPAQHNTDFSVPDCPS